MSQWITFDLFPFPPSVNECYVNNPRTRGRFPSQKLKAYKIAVSVYFSRVNLSTNNQELLTRYGHIQSLVGKELELECDFVMPYTRLYTSSGERKGLPKKLDLDNFQKALFDNFFEAIGIDDSMIFKITARKFAMPKGNVGQEAYVTIKIRPYTIQPDAG